MTELVASDVCCARAGRVVTDAEFCLQEVTGSTGETLLRAVKEGMITHPSLCRVIQTRNILHLLHQMSGNGLFNTKSEASMQSNAVAKMMMNSRSER
ncbi:hypothetical protein Dimus_037240 [Dionaea muscipula]